jgi:hypothetical protein
MSSVDTLPKIICPNCRQPMQAENFERHDHGTVQLDLCYLCAGIWFHHLASVLLAPAAVIELFKQIYAHSDDVRRPTGSQLACPRCGDNLALSYDLGKAGRFSYYRCAQGDGRFTPFFQFLREKQFVRDLTLAELQRVRAQVRQIRCSACGAPIDLEHDSQCKFCHAAVSFLDPDAVEKAARLWSDAEHRRELAPTSDALGNTVSQLQLHEQGRTAPAGFRFGDSILLAGANTVGGAALGVDLVDWGIHAIGRLFDRGD